MTRDPVVAWPSMPVREAAARMAECGVSGLPVVDGLGRVVGVIADSDLLPEQRSAPEPAGEETRAASAGPVVAEVMTMPAATCSPELTVAGAAEVMRRTGLHRLVVVGAGGALLGVVSRGDLAAALRTPQGARHG
ncbi:CBS domain-containing protein [Gandjariella thermophila]|nr:CBS domain-containing protein [Gandjariella thermophila]